MVVHVSSIVCITPSTELCTAAAPVSACFQNKKDAEPNLFRTSNCVSLDAIHFQLQFSVSSVVFLSPLLSSSLTAVSMYVQPNRKLPSDGLSANPIKTGKPDRPTRTGTKPIQTMAGGKEPSPKVSKRKGGAKARKAAKAAEAAALAAGVDGITLTEKGGGGGGDNDGPQARNASGILASEARARDIKIQSFSLSFHSKILVEDSTIEMNYGRRCVETNESKRRRVRQIPVFVRYSAAPLSRVKLLCVLGRVLASGLGLVFACSFVIFLQDDCFVLFQRFLGVWACRVWQLVDTTDRLLQP